jgi:hypothetical protein
VIGWRGWSPLHVLNRQEEEFKEFEELPEYKEGNRFGM